MSECDKCKERWGTKRYVQACTVLLGWLARNFKRVDGAAADDAVFRELANLSMDAAELYAAQLIDEIRNIEIGLPDVDVCMN